MSTKTQSSKLTAIPPSFTTRSSLPSLLRTSAMRAANAASATSQPPYSSSSSPLPLLITVQKMPSSTDLQAFGEWQQAYTKLAQQPTKEQNCQQNQSGARLCQVMTRFSENPTDRRDFVTVRSGDTPVAAAVISQPGTFSHPALKPLSKFKFPIYFIEARVRAPGNAHKGTGKQVQQYFQQVAKLSPSKCVVELSEAVPGTAQDRIPLDVTPVEPNTTVVVNFHGNGCPCKEAVLKAFSAKILV